MEFELEHGLLRSVRPDDADELYELIAANRGYLAEWMPWAAGQTLEDTQGFIASAIRQAEADDGLQLALTLHGRIVGVLGFHRVDTQNRSTSIGYWLAEGSQGQGLMTAAVKRLVSYAFTDLELHRVEIRAAPANGPSRALCARLGFVEEGVLREAERIRDSYNDLVVSSMLSGDWRG